MNVTVYSRPGCHLCDEALAGLAVLTADRVDVDVEVVDIDRDDELLKRYLERIPVVAIGDEVLSELVFDREAVATRLGQIP